MTAYDSTIEPSTFITTALDSSFGLIDWQVPWLCHLSQLDYLRQTIGLLSTPVNDSEVVVEVKERDSATIIAKLLNAALKQKNSSQALRTKPILDHQAHHLQFVSQDALPEGEGYEHFIATTGKIPTRNNLHDLFNGSIWLTFPKTKAVLNYYHMLELAKQSSDDNRGRVRDTITVFDENGAILVTADPSIGEALVDFDWQASLVTPRAKWDNPKKLNIYSQAAVYIFGHALIEQLVQPRKPLCAHSVVINVAADFFALSLPERIAYLDEKLAKQMDNLLSQHDITPRKLAPLPILGVPHFWTENADSSFYDDRYVFRSGRRR